MKPYRTLLAAIATLPTLMPLAPPAFAHDLPVGDGKVTAYPAVGNVFACNQNFRTVGAPTGTFPIARSDPAYAFDTNTNSIAKVAMAFSVPSQPAKAETPGRLSRGMIGFTVTGVAFYNALDDAGNDAAAHEVQDLCSGHPQGRGQYHYHSSSPCLAGADRNALVGWALEGYPILGMVDASGRALGNADLDACHGCSENISIEWRTYDYAYRLTPEYPYTLGCFTGKVQRDTIKAIRAAMGPPRQRGVRGNLGQGPNARTR
jgi:hypothetical protein